MPVITIQLNETTFNTLKKLYEDETQIKPSGYVKYCVKPEGCTITVYTSNKCVFQGNEAEYHASTFSAITQKKSIFKEQAGSDEVGTGDYFGPVCVCATMIKEEYLPIIGEWNIQDSKAIKDEQILQIAPKLMELVPYSLLVLDNTKYNSIHSANNMNRIKARLHNQAFLHLKSKLNKLPSFIIIDQFTPEASYYKYLHEEKEVIRGIHFETKAENKYIAVACASIIARYAFLKAFEQMESHYHFHFLKGASAKVDDNAKEFVQQFGKEELKHVAKLHFANTNRVLEKEDK